MWLCQMQRHAVDEAAHQRAPAGPQQFWPDLEIARQRQRAPLARKQMQRQRKDHDGTWSSRRSTASTSPLSSRNRPRSTVENTSRFSRTPSRQRADKMAASSSGKAHVSYAAAGTRK